MPADFSAEPRPASTWKAVFDRIARTLHPKTGRFRTGPFQSIDRIESWLETRTPDELADIETRLTGLSKDGRKMFRSIKEVFRVDPQKTFEFVVQWAADEENAADAPTPVEGVITHTTAGRKALFDPAVQQPPAERWDDMRSAILEVLPDVGEQLEERDHKKIAAAFVMAMQATDDEERVAADLWSVEATNRRVASECKREQGQTAAGTLDGLLALDRNQVGRPHTRATRHEKFLYGRRAILESYRQRVKAEKDPSERVRLLGECDRELLALAAVTPSPLRWSTPDVGECDR